MMHKEYQTFVSSPDILVQGEEIKLAVRDLSPGVRKYEGKIVRAVVADDPAKLEGADTLWLRSLVGRKHEKPWAIKIVADVGDCLACQPYQNGIEVNQLLKEL